MPENNQVNSSESDLKKDTNLNFDNEISSNYSNLVLELEDARKKINDIF